MKQLLTIFLIAFFFCSCSAIKKTTNKTQTNSDSTGSKSSVLVDIKKKDSVGTGVVKTTETKASDNTYTKTTTTKEYYTDEFDFEGSVDTSNGNAHTGTTIAPNDYFPYKKPQDKTKNPGKLLYKETTTKEVGTLQTKENKEQLSKQKSDVHEVDNKTKKEDQKTQASKEENKVNKSKDVFRFLPGIGVVLFVLILLYIGYRYYKKQQLLKI